LKKGNALAVVTPPATTPNMKNVSAVVMGGTMARATTKQLKILERWTSATT